MADRPIIMSAPMVRALLDGRKTQTRRVLKPQPERNVAGLWRYPPDFEQRAQRNWRGFCQTDEDGLRQFILNTPHCPYAPGDRLWVRECFSYRHEWTVDQRDGPIWYWSDGNPDHGNWTRPKPSIHMPRRASRLTLLVTDVRVQRVRDISEADARAEGMKDWSTLGTSVGFGRIGWDKANGRWDTYHEAFKALWDTLNAKRGYGWDANPWVVALTFEVRRVAD